MQRRYPALSLSSSCRFFGIFLLLAVAAPQLHAWGPDGHIIVTRVAAGRIPRDMPLFFRSARPMLEYLCNEPDRWRDDREKALKDAQAPEHYSDMERVAWLAEFPPNRFEFMKALYEYRAKADPAKANDYLPERVGLQPYPTYEVYGRLKQGFREYRELRAAKKPTVEVERKIVFYAGWLSHYVGDIANPLHTTIHYNGWVGENPKGYSTAKIHWGYESEHVKLTQSAVAVQPLVNPPARQKNVSRDFVQYMRDSLAQVEPLYTLEKTGAFAKAGTPEGREFTRRRLAAGGQMLVNLWYTAWLESGDEPPIQRQRD